MPYDVLQMSLGLSHALVLPETASKRLARLGAVPVEQQKTQKALHLARVDSPEHMSR
jgi:hypothetical protein